MDTNKLKKLITILGPTSSGKSDLAIKLALALNGEIISADSRQVYKNLDIGTGKVSKSEQKKVKHHLLDIVEPGDNFSVARFQKMAFEKIDEIYKKGKLPFLVGGTALYIYSVIDNYKFNKQKINKKRRSELEKLLLPELKKIINNFSSNNVANISADDWKNPRRLIRLIEKLELGQSIESKKGKTKYKNIILGINMPREELYKKIDARIEQRIKKGMIQEVENLRKKRISDKWLISLGLEYKLVTQYLQGQFSKIEMIEKLKFASHAFARRQLTWHRRDKRIVWIKNPANYKPDQLKNLMNIN